MNNEEILTALESLNNKICEASKPPTTEIEIAVNLLWQLIVCEKKEAEVVNALFSVLNKKQ